MIKISRGLDVPIIGAPQQTVSTAKVNKVALLPADFVGIKPSLLIQEGDKVQAGQAILKDRNNPGIVFTAPLGGIVQKIKRGARRMIESITIATDENAPRVAFSKLTDKEILNAQADFIRQRLIESGAWVALRTRPFSKIPTAESTPDALFITAIDTHPLSVDPRIAAKELDPTGKFFHGGVAALSKIAPIFLCQAPGDLWQGADLPNVKTEIFEGPHPAGLPSTHIHFLRPASLKHTVWHVNYQDVIAIGALFLEGQFLTERVIALAGPVVKKPRLIKTHLGADLLALTQNELKEGENRIVSGSILGGRTAKADTAFLGRYHLQVSCLKEGREREMFHYFRLGFNKHSVKNIFISKLLGNKKFAMDTSTNGSARAIVSVGNYESVMPLDILATPLLRYLVAGDTEMAQKLGALELDEEDLALCSYVCAGKYEYGPILRDVLTRIEKEG